ncbi:MAG TPA: serine hydrolase domain-containing protein [Steroidobacteraceae bacterium]
MYRAAVERGKIVWQDPAAPPAPWWSLSKTAIAAAALVLVQQGRLALDEPLSGHEFTLRQLLQHVAGVPDYGSLAEYHQAVASGLPPWSRTELLDRVDAQRLRSKPGTRFVYSNVGYTVVRGLIEGATGSHLRDALDGLVFRPLGLEDVRVASVPADLDMRPWGSLEGYHPGWVFHGLVVGTPAQAALFLDRLLGGELLGDVLLESMREPVTISNTAAYGLGLMIDLRSPWGACYGHTGEGPGSTTATYRFEASTVARTVSVFAAMDDRVTVEREALALAMRGGLRRCKALISRQN